MTDITKCDGTGCPIRTSCERYTAPSGPWQSWFVTVPGQIDRTLQPEGVWVCEQAMTRENYVPPVLPR